MKKIDQLPLYTEKGNARKIPSEELVKEFDRELDNLSPLDDEVVSLSKKKKNVMVKKSVLREQFPKKQ